MTDTIPIQTKINFVEYVARSFSSRHNLATKEDRETWIREIAVNDFTDHEMGGLFDLLFDFIPSRDKALQVLSELREDKERQEMREDKLRQEIREERERKRQYILKQEEYYLQLQQLQQSGGTFISCATPPLSRSNSSPSTTHYQNSMDAVEAEHNLCMMSELQYEPISQADYYFHKLRFVLSQKKFNITAEFDGSQVILTHISGSQNRSLNLAVPPNMETMRNIYLLVALCDKETVLSDLIFKNFYRK